MIENMILLSESAVAQTPMQDWQIIKTILLLGSIAAAIGGIAALIAKIVKAVKKGIGYFVGLRTDIDTLVKHDGEQYKAILRLTVMNENMPLSERIAAGKKYIELDGNGDVRHFYETQLKPYDHIERKEE